MRMIDLGNGRGPIHIIDTSTAVDCTKDVRFRRSFRSFVECMVPCCGFHESSSESVSSTDYDAFSTTSSSSSSTTTTTAAATTTTVTGTFLGPRKGRISFCIHEAAKSLHPLLLLEFTVPTTFLAREMQYGLLRVALECNKARTRPGSGPLYGVPVWNMYCNGRKVGFAVRRQVTDADVAVFRTMQSVSVGAGVLPGGDLMYLRASFERVIGSADSESFHMINPVGSTGQELSIFLLRS